MPHQITRPPQPKKPSRKSKIGDRVYYIDSITKEKYFGEVIDCTTEGLHILWDGDLNPTTHYFSHFPINHKP